jgi:two-component system, sensor histidine kinase RpfC
LIHMLIEAKRRIRVTLKALRARTDPPELECGLIRMGFAATVLICFLAYARRDGLLDPVEQKVLIAILLFFAASIALLFRIIWAGDVSVFRRYAGMVVDNAAITYFMVIMGEAGSVMFGLYLFIIFGNGFRYGRTYLYVCQAMALVGFGSVLLLDTRWSQFFSVGLALFCAMLVLPFYVSVLAQRITDAKRRADEANQAQVRLLEYVSHEMGKPLNTIIAEYNESVRQKEK